MAFMLSQNFCCIILLHVVPSRKATRAICYTLKTQVKLSLNFTRSQCDLLYKLVVSNSRAIKFIQT